MYDKQLGVKSTHPRGTPVQFWEDTSAQNIYCLLHLYIELRKFWGLWKIHTI